MNIRTICTTKEIREAGQLLPGAVFLGMLSDPKFSNGKEVPLLAPKVPEGRPSINSLEGWNAFCKKNNTNAFIGTFSREPFCDAELRAWEDSHFSNDFRWEGATT